MVDLLVILEMGLIKNFIDDFAFYPKDVPVVTFDFFVSLPF
jgi:hypothetical protein